ncbi:MAG: OmpH family outer membrane protein [Paludibacteraceae bacterium]|nr:OmpH family outer membrane protein [Paludibacteraceae bacterium]
MKRLFLMLALVMPLALSAQKFGHVNTQELFSQMPELNKVKQQIDTLQGQYETQIANMQEEFNKKVTDFQKSEATLADAVKQIRQQELAEMEQRIQLFYQTAQQDIQKKQQELLAPLHEKMTKAIQEVGTANGFTYIFDSAAMVYISPDATDATPLVRQKLGIK